MVNWKAILQESPRDYLLEEDNSSVRYFTSRDILGKEERDSEVTAAKHAIADSPIVKKIFQKQRPNGYWNNPANPYLPKYKSSYWQMNIRIVNRHNLYHRKKKGSLGRPRLS